MIEKILLLGLICAKSATAQAANPPATAGPTRISGHDLGPDRGSSTAQVVYLRYRLHPP